MALLDTTCDFSAPVYRNIVSLRVSQNLFDDLIPDSRGQQAAISAEMRVRSAWSRVSRSSSRYLACMEGCDMVCP